MKSVNSLVGVVAAGLAGSLAVSALAADGQQAPMAAGTTAVAPAAPTMPVSPTVRMATTNAMQRPGLLALYDTNGDGKVAKEEYLAAMEKRFTGMDANGDGALTSDELMPQRRMAAPGSRVGAPVQPRVRPNQPNGTQQSGTQPTGTQPTGTQPAAQGGAK